MPRHTRQAVRADRSGAGRWPLTLRHLLLLACLGLVTTATTARAADDASLGWASEIAAAPLGGGGEGRPLAAYPGQLRLPARDQTIFGGLMVQSATSGLRPAGDQAAPFYQIVLGDPSGPEHPIQALLYGAPGAKLFPTFGGGPTRPAGCDGAATYCTEDLYASGAPTGESFYGLTSVSGDQARVVHTRWRDRESWTVLLHNPDANVTYGFTLHDQRAGQVGASGLGPENLALARGLVEVAAAFQPVKLAPTAGQAGL